MFEFLKNIIQPKEIKEPGDIKFKDCIKSISAKHGSRGSLLQNLLVSYVTDEEHEHEEWRINSLMSEEPRKGEHD